MNSSTPLLIHLHATYQESFNSRRVLLILRKKSENKRREENEKRDLPFTLIREFSGLSTRKSFLFWYLMSLEMFQSRRYQNQDNKELAP